MKVCKYCLVPHKKKEKNITYREYLKSNHWKNIRRAYFLSRAPKNCFICGSDKNLNLHHRTYKHLWKEMVGTHLNVLCHQCHKDIHFKYKKTPLTWTSLRYKQRKLLKEFRRVGASAAHQNESSSTMQNTTDRPRGNQISFL